MDDSPDIRDSLSEYLRLSDFEVVTFESAVGVCDAFGQYHPELVILDVMLPGGDGFTLAKEIRSLSRVPIIFLTARESESDRITGFELGADDYVVKPFSLKEFVLRVQALLRRTGTAGEPARECCSWSREGLRLELFFQAHRVELEGRELHLTLSEWKILDYISSRACTVVGREEILSRVLELPPDCGDRVVDTHVKNIRAKLGDPGWIETVRGFGYRFSGLRDS